MSQQRQRSTKPSSWIDAANVLKNLRTVTSLTAKSAYCFVKYGKLTEAIKKEIGGYTGPRGKIYNPPEKIVQNEIVMQCSELPKSEGGASCPFLNTDYDQLMKEKNRRMKAEIRDVDEYDIEGEVDVCIIGTGPGGSAAAYALSERYKEELGKGDKKIVMLERGGLYTSDEFSQKEKTLLPALYQNPLRFSDDFGIALVKGSLVGGSAVLNDAICFEAPSRVTQDWEVDVGRELREKRIYRKVRDMIHYKKIPHMAQHKNARMFEKGVETEDLEHFLLNERNTNPRIPHQPMRPQHQLACVGCGFCHLGCRYNRKQTPLITFVPAAMDNGVRVFKNATVSKVLHSGGAVRGVRVKRGLGRRDLIIKAKKVIVSCGAVNSSQLLLRSGVENQHLGKHISLHPAPLIFGVFDEKVYPDWGIPMTSAYEKYQFPSDDKKVFPDGFGYLIETIANHPIAQAASLPAGKVRARMRQYENTASATVILHDQAVGEVKKRHGHITPLTYKLHREDQIKMKHGIKEAARIFLNAGAREVFTSHEKETAYRSLEELERVDIFNEDHLPLGPGKILLGSAHSQGGCRMATTGDRGVVDFNGHSHDVENLYVSDGSLFPTSLGVNPQVTIMALATKIGESIDLGH